MTHWRTLVGNSENLSPDDLDGRMVTATIEAVAGGVIEEDSDSGERKTSRKAMIAFAGKVKKLAANTINCQLLEAMWGSDYEGWVGHRVTLKPDTVEVRGQYYGEPCVRVAGSPELHASITVSIKMPRRKPIKRTLIPTKTGASEPLFDTETGEVVPEDLDEKYGATVPEGFGDLGEA